jgi:hypothetical protein
MPEDPKLAEFREKNIALLKELDDLKTKYDGIHPETVKADRAKLAAFEQQKPDERIADLEARLASSEASRLEAQKQTDVHILESKIADAFLKAGAEPKARAFLISQAAGMFTLENGVLKGTKFSPSRPGEPMNIDEFILLQTRENSFAFKPSGGGGAPSGHGGGGGTSNLRELRDPSPQDLGRYASDIAAGRVRVVHSS